MILNVSGRTDIVAFYMDWFINRYKEGFLDVRNPFYPKMVSRINFKDVDLILFCTKNPIPILKYIDEIDKPKILHITITPYKRDIEPNIPSKDMIIESVKKLSKKFGIDNIFIRYDPIFISDKYNIDYHIKAFDKLCSLLNGHTRVIIVSFLDIYKNVIKNKRDINFRELNEDDYKKIGIHFSESAKRNGITVQTCSEERNLIEYGFRKDDCISSTLAFKLTGKIYKNWTARKQKNCKCASMVDIGVYNSCKHFCKYCYANYDENMVKNNFNNHNPNSSLLIGQLNSSDIIKERFK